MQLHTGLLRECLTAEACVAHRIGELHQLVRVGGTEQYCGAMDERSCEARVITRFAANLEKARKWRRLAADSTLRFQREQAVAEKVRYLSGIEHDS